MVLTEERPSVLKDLLSIPHFSAVKPLKLSVYAPYHASHIFSASVVDAILAASDSHILNTYKPRIPQISCSTGRRVAVSTYGSLLRAVLEDILIKQLRWDLVLGGCYTELIQTALQGAQFRLFPILTNAAPTLASSLSQAAALNVPIDGAIAEHSSKSFSANNSGKMEQSKIAIVGHSGRFPDAASTEAFWELLHEGRDVHRAIPKDRFDAEAHFDPTGKTKNTSRIQHGCFIEEPGLFDARFFNMSPRESCQADPGQRLAITTAYEAMEMAGFVPDTTPSSQRDRIGIFYGMTSDDWREVNSGQNVDTYFIPGGNRAFTPGRINYHFKFSGPSFSIDTACSSSFAAIHTACNSLWRGDCDTAIAGGTNVMTNPDNFAGLDRGHFLSTTGNCNTFDDGANGYCRADAVGTVILKRLEDAEADNDPIYGVLLGAYTNHSAEADSMTRPHVGAQSFIFNKMLNQANVNPLDISYIEMHGTGTQTGDAVEMKSVLEVFAKRPRGVEHPLYLGSAKASIGHAESASGICSLIKVLKMMEKSEIPPHCGIKTKINHGFPTDLQARNVNIALAPTTWRRPQNGKRTVFLNNFSAAGGNTALLMEDAPVRTAPGAEDGRSSHIVSVSAKSIHSLDKNIQSMIRFIDDTPGLSLPALSYTTTARRMHHNHRVAVTGHNVREIREALQQLGPSKNIRPIQAAKIPNVAFAFTGQGCLYSGMAKGLFDNISSFRSDIQRFDQIAHNLGFPTFLPLVDGSRDVDELGPVVSQLGAASVQMALNRLWASWGVLPRAVIGHSLGEYAALNAAGVLSVSDTIYLTGARAELLEKYCTIDTHSMLAVKASPASLDRYISKTSCEIACINGPEEIVLSGNLSEIATISRDLTTAGFKCVKLELPFAFHSAQVEAILEKLEALAQDIVFKKPSIPYISPLLSEVITEIGVLGPSYLSRACRETVNFVGGLSAAVEAKSISDKTIWIEIGAHPVCSSMVKSTVGAQATTIPTLRKSADTWKVITNSLAVLHTAGIDLHWNEYHRDFKESQYVLQLPAYSWDAKNYWIQYNNNFCLTKGNDIPKAICAPEPTLSRFSTTSVQRIVEESHGPHTSAMIIESNLSDPVLAKAIHGHKVNGAALCPSSLYADIGLTIGEYLLKKSPVYDESIGVDVADMKVGNPLVANGNQPQLFRTSASACWDTRTADLHIYSVSAEGKKTIDHARCKIRFGDRNEWSKEFKRNAYLINRQIAALQNGVNHGKSHKIKRGMAYKLFGAVVQYDQAYQGMQEVVLDSEMLEATAQVKFQTTEKNGNFNVGPYWIDSLGHVAGFIMNANENTDPSLQVFVNHGWDRMRCTKAFSPERTYQVYNRMQNIGGTLHSGDTYILEDANVIAVFEGVKVSCTSPSPNIILTVNSSKECLAPCSIICYLPRARVRAICQPSRSANRQISLRVRG
jgi:naphtho-gamma-pyrone polyketide synthase